MKAIVFEEFGGPEVLRLADVDEPHAGPGEIRVAVRAAGVNPLDHKVRRGWLESLVPTRFPSVPGQEVAGVVDEVGEGVTGFAVGDEVVGWAKTGSYAQYALAENVAHKPAGVSFEQAVAFPVAGETARRALRELAVRRGETLLLHGASGAVGTLAVQFAVGLGATVVGTASPENHARLRELGAVPVAYGDGLVARVRAAAPQGVDAVLDAAGQGALPASIELRGGTTERILTIADMSAGEFGVAMSVAPSSTPEGIRQDLAEQLRLADEGRLTVRIADALPLSAAAKAQETSEGGHAGGKLVLVP